MALLEQEWVNTPELKEYDESFPLKTKDKSTETSGSESSGVSMEQRKRSHSPSSRETEQEGGKKPSMFLNTKNVLLISFTL